MKKFEIHSYKDFAEMTKQFNNYFIKRDFEGKKFLSLVIISKRYRKSRTSKQLKAYWVCIHEMKKAFLEIGYRFNEDELHSFVKRESGFTKMITLENGKQLMIEKSISDESEDVNIVNINFLIEYIIEFSAINLNYEIKLNETK